MAKAPNKLRAPSSLDEERAQEKQRMRDADSRSLANGKSPEDIRRANAAFAIQAVRIRYR